MTTNTAPFKFGSETFKTSYTVYGDLTSNSSATAQRPLIVLNGGPGLAHWYMLPHADLHSTRGRPVVLYDQLGCGLSTRLRDKPASFFTPALFAAELDNLVRHLRIAHDFDLLAQSWGVTLAIEYVAAHRPAGLNHLVLVSGPASYPLWREALARLRSQWPRDFQEVLERHEKDGTTDAPEYQEALLRFYGKHICNLKVWPPETFKTMAEMAEDPTVYRAMYVVRVCHLLAACL
jgi:proline-specific peptidase